MPEAIDISFDFAANWKYFVTPIICALIGWLTNYVAVKMLFRPRKPLNFLLFKIQGVFPKRQSALAENLGRAIEKNLISHDDIQKVIADPSFHQVFASVAEERVDDFLNEKLVGINPMVGMFLNDELKGKIKAVLMQEMDDMLPNLLESAAGELEKRLVFSEMVKEKVEQFDSEKIEELLFAVMKQEFRFIEIIGGILGFIIGVAQSAMFYFA